MRKLATFILYILFASMVFETAFAQRGFEPEPEETYDEKVSLKNIVDDLVKDYRRKNPSSGLVIGLYNDTAKAIISYGANDKPERPKPDKFTLYETGSVTKPFTALLALEMERKGLLQLTDAVSKHLPDSLNNPHLENINLLDLISHQSGMPKKPLNLSVTKTDNDNPYQNYTNQHFLEYLSVYKPLKQKKKMKFRYSDMAYGVLGMILEKVGGRPFNTLLRQHVLKPLALSNSHLILNGTKQELLALPFTFNGSPTSKYSYKSSMEASSGLYSCAADLLDFIELQIKDQPDFPLSESVKKSHGVLSKTNMKRISMTYGWHKISRGRKYPPVYVHNGGTGGYFTYLAFIKETRTGVVILSNSSNRVDLIGVELMELLN